MIENYEISKEELKQLINSQLLLKNRDFNLIAKNLVSLSCNEQIEILHPKWLGNVDLILKLEKSVMIAFLKRLVEEGNIFKDSLLKAIISLDEETQKSIFQPLIDNDYQLLKQNIPSLQSYNMEEAKEKKKEKEAIRMLSEKKYLLNHLHTLFANNSNPLPTARELFLNYPTDKFVPMGLFASDEALFKTYKQVCTQEELLKGFKSIYYAFNFYLKPERWKYAHGLQRHGKRVSYFLGLLEQLSIQQLKDSTCLSCEYDRTLIWLFAIYDIVDNNNLLEKALNLMAKLDSKQQLELLNKPGIESTHEVSWLHYGKKFSTPIQMVKKTSNSHAEYLLKRAECIAKMKRSLETLEHEISHLKNYSDIKNHQPTDFFKKNFIGPNAYNDARIKAQTLDQTLSESLSTYIASDKTPSDAKQLLLNWRANIGVAKSSLLVECPSISTVLTGMLKILTGILCPLYGAYLLYQTAINHQQNRSLLFPSNREAELNNFEFLEDSTSSEAKANLVSGNS